MEKRDQWLAELEAGGACSKRDMELLARASQVLEDNVIDMPNAPWGSCTGIRPSPGPYRGVWNWDSAFHALTVSRWDYALAQQQFRIFFLCQGEDGLFPDVIFEDGKRMDNYSKPPVFPWAFVEVYRRHPDRSFLEEAYPYYVKNERFWRTKRFEEAEGLFHYDAVHVDNDWLTHIKWESGMDDSPRWDKKIQELWPVDLNSYMVTFYDAMAFMASELQNGEAEGWKAKREALAEKINERLWDNTLQAYVDTDRYTGESTGVLTPASFAPLFARCADRDKAKRMAEIAADPAFFYPGMPTVSYNYPAFDPTLFWRGPTWLNMAYFAAKGLKNYGYDELAESFRQTILGWCDQDKRDIFEYYNPRTGEGLGAIHFGWSSCFIIEFILGW